MNEDMRGKMRTDVRKSERNCSLLFLLYLSNTNHSACTSLRFRAFTAESLLSELSLREGAR